MKKLIVLLAICSLVYSCKKDGGGAPKKIFLAKIIVDGHPEIEYTYNAQGQITEERGYDEHSPFALVYRNEFIYDKSGNLVEMKGYDMPSNKLNAHLIYKLDAQGRIVRTSYFSVNGVLPGTFSTYIDNEYNGKGLVSKQTWKDEDEKVQTFRNLQYYPNGNLRNSESWSQWGGPVAEKSWASSYGPSDTTLPATFYSVKAFPINFYYNYLTCSYIRHFNYDDDGNVSSEYREDMTGRQFNAKGLITQETITTKQIKPAGTESVRLLQFEYVEK